MYGKQPIRKTDKKMDPQYGGRAKKGRGDLYNGTGYVVDRDVVDARRGEYASDLSHRVAGR